MNPFTLIPTATLALALAATPAARDLASAPAPGIRTALPAGQQARQDSLDARVRRFLDAHRGRWRDMNVSAVDGQRLYDLILENGYTRALEIGTSTGHSAIWIAWALSKTGGKLITVEIDDGRYREALDNFREAGLSDYIDARLADAHTLVPRLEGPFDFVFVDADKAWNSRYFQAVYPKLVVGGCFTVHNVTRRRTGWVAELLDTLEATPGMETQVIGTYGYGMSVSYKRESAGS